MNERKARVNKYPRLRLPTPLARQTGQGYGGQAAGRFKNSRQSASIRTKVVGYPSDHRVEQPKGLSKFIRNWLF